YGVLERISANPVVELNRAVAAAMVHGPATGLKMIEALDAGGRLPGHHRVHAAWAHLLEMAGEHTAAVTEYRRAANGTTSLAERLQQFQHPGVVAARFAGQRPGHRVGDVVVADAHRVRIAVRHPDHLRRRPRTDPAQRGEPAGRLGRVGGRLQLAGVRGTAAD